MCRGCIFGENYRERGVFIPLLFIHPNLLEFQ
jgi:hypothetical protein